MSLYVVDPNVAVKWFLKEPHTEQALRLLDGRNQLHAPDFYLMEVDNVLCKRIRRGDISVLKGRRIRTALRQFPVQTHAFAPLLDPAYEIANRTGRSLYDCLYLAVAALLGGRVATADRRLHDGLTDGPFAKHVVWVEDIA